MRSTLKVLTGSNIAQFSLNFAEFLLKRDDLKFVFLFFAFKFIELCPRPGVNASSLANSFSPKCYLTKNLIQTTRSLFGLAQSKDWSSLAILGSPFWARDWNLTYFMNCSFNHKAKGVSETIKILQLKLLLDLAKIQFPRCKMLCLLLILAESDLK